MEYVSRHEWGALDSGKGLSEFRRTPVGVVVHHTTGSAKDPWARVRQHDKFHVQTRGWNSIAYNWLVSGETGEAARGCRVVPLFGVLVPRALAELALAEALGVLVLLPRLWRARRLRPGRGWGGEEHTIVVRGAQFGIDAPHRCCAC